jgi:hypothetical protein
MLILVPMLFLLHLLLLLILPLLTRCCYFAHAFVAATDHAANPASTRAHDDVALALALVNIDTYPRPTARLRPLPSCQAISHGRNNSALIPHANNDTYPRPTACLRHVLYL